MKSFPVPKKIIISRTDSIGDVLLTLPLAGILKKHFPEVEVIFLCSDYTAPIIEVCQAVDGFISKKKILQSPESLGKYEADIIIFVFPDKELAAISKKVGIPVRIGTSRRWYHWLYLNKMVNFSRKKSELHEAELNQKLLIPLGISEIIPKTELHHYFQFKGLKKLQGPLKRLLDTTKTKIILHPKSKGSAREWSLSNFQSLIELLPKDLFSIFITGTGTEKEIIEKEDPYFLNQDGVIDLTGKMSLEELVSFIQGADYLVACSTGPLHLAGLLGIGALGIYPPIKPIHSARWSPLGENIQVLNHGKMDCVKCKGGGICACINENTAIQVYEAILIKNRSVLNA